MTDGFGVVPEAVHRASQAAQSASAQVHGVDVAAAFTSVAEATPGSATARSAGIAADTITGMLQGWVEQATRYAAGLEAGAVSYRTTDQAAAGAAFPGLGGPVR